MDRIALTREELEMLRRLAERQKASPGDTLRRLIVREALRWKMLPQPAPRPG